MPRANASFERMTCFLATSLSRRFVLDSIGCALTECIKYSVDVNKYRCYRTGDWASKVVSLLHAVFCLKDFRQLENEKTCLGRTTLDSNNSIHYF